MYHPWKPSKKRELARQDKIGPAVGSLKFGYAAHVFDAFHLLSRTWLDTSSNSIANCWQKAQCLPAEWQDKNAQLCETMMSLHASCKPPWNRFKHCCFEFVTNGMLIQVLTTHENLCLCLVGCQSKRSVSDSQRQVLAAGLSLSAVEDFAFAEEAAEVRMPNRFAVFCTVI